MYGTIPLPLGRIVDICRLWSTKLILVNLKGTATLIITMFYMKDLNKPWILIPVSFKLVEKCGSCRRLNISKWTVMEAAIL